MPFDTEAKRFFDKGWVRFDHDPRIDEWVAAARPLADAAAADPALRKDWLRCGGTWFVGVNVFPNGADGAVPDRGVPPLAGDAVEFTRQVLGFRDFAWDNAQISICYPGYPRQGAGESLAAFRYRRDRDAAHVDGLLPFGSDRRRKPAERHGFILGLPLGPITPGSSPVVVWEGSHKIMRRALGEALAGIDPNQWREADVTEAYHAARRECFEACERVDVEAAAGEAYLVHRLALHGVAPWTGPDGPPRTIAYFRPDPSPDASPEWWLDAD